MPYGLRAEQAEEAAAEAASQARMWLPITSEVQVHVDEAEAAAERAKRARDENAWAADSAVALAAAIRCEEAAADAEDALEKAMRIGDRIAAAIMQASAAS